MLPLIKVLLFVLLVVLLIVHVIYKLIILLCFEKPEEDEEKSDAVNYIKPVVSCFVYLLGFYAVLTESLPLVIALSIFVFLLFVADLLMVLIETSFKWTLIIDLAALVLAGTYGYLLREDLPFKRPA